MVKIDNSEDTQKTIWLIRHAESIANKNCVIQGHFDTELTPTGLIQAEQNSIYFETNKTEFQIQNIFSSDLIRAKQTAQPIAEKLDLSIQFDSNLREAYFGRWEGLPAETVFAEEKEIYEKWRADRTWRPEWCESFNKLQERGLSTLKEISKSKGNSIVITHGGLIHSIFINLMGNSDHISLNNCSLNKLKVSANKMEIEEINILAPNVPDTKFKLAEVV